MEAPHPASQRNFYDAVRARSRLPPLIVDLLEHAHDGLPHTTEDSDSTDVRRTRARCQKLIDLCRAEAKRASGPIAATWSTVAKGFDFTLDFELGDPGNAVVRDLFFWTKLIGSLP